MAIRKTASLFAALIATAVATSSAQAVVLYSSSTNNATDPGDSSGYDLIGQWGGFSGVPIGPHHALVARHTGGSVGQTFTFQSVGYTTTAFYNDTASDLRIIEISGTFPTWAELYRDSDELTKTLTVHGRNRVRGTAVSISSDPKGWLVGTTNVNSNVTWGKNVVSGFAGYQSASIKSTVTAGNANLLYFNFDEAGITNEAATTAGDSGGGIFIQDDGVWKLAGINFASFTSQAFIDDYGGMPALYTGPSNAQVLAGGVPGAGNLFDIKDLYVKIAAPDVPSSFALTQDFFAPSAGNLVTAGYASRISARASWIDSIVPPTEVPEPASMSLLAAGAGLMMFRRRRGV